MSGSGRKSHYRKSITEEVLNGLPVPDLAVGERVARVVCSRGGNLLEVECGAPPPGTVAAAIDAGGAGAAAPAGVGGGGDGGGDGVDDDVALAMLPTKFRKLIWVKRGDFVIVSRAAGDGALALRGDILTLPRAAHVAAEARGRARVSHFEPSGRVIATTDLVSLFATRVKPRKRTWGF